MREQQRIHVLVADDEPHIGRIIKMKLEQGRFRVTLAYDGREALEVLRRKPALTLIGLPHAPSAILLARAANAKNDLGVIAARARSDVIMRNAKDTRARERLQAIGVA